MPHNTRCGPLWIKPKFLRNNLDRAIHICAPLRNEIVSRRKTFCSTSNYERLSPRSLSFDGLGSNAETKQMRALTSPMAILIVNRLLCLCLHPIAHWLRWLWLVSLAADPNMQSVYRLTLNANQCVQERLNVSPSSLPNMPSAKLLLSRMINCHNFWVNVCLVV